MFNIKKLLLIDALTFIPGETQNCNWFTWIPSNSQSRSHYLYSYSKAESTVRPATLSYSTTQFDVFHYDIKLMCCSVLFVRSLLCKVAKKYMLLSKNNWQDQSLTGQVRNQAGHCPLTGCYFQPWWWNKSCWPRYCIEGIMAIKREEIIPTTKEDVLQEIWMAWLLWKYCKSRYTCSGIHC